MANDFKITISAVDKATATVHKINASMAKMVSPVTDFQKSMTSLKDATGLNVVVKGLSGIGRSATDAAEGIGKIVAPIAALFGIGTIAGVTELATSFGKLGFNISKTAASIGISTRDLQLLRGAASMAGISAGELDSGLVSLGSTMEGAMFGRNQDAMLLMNRFGITLHRLKDGSVDTQRGLMDISRAMQGLNAQQQHLLAGGMGVESFFSLLQKGPAVISAYKKAVDAVGGVMDGPAIKAAENFEIKMAGLHGAIDGLTNRIGAKLIPILSPLIDQFSAWVAINKDFIATNVGEFVKEIGEWLKTVDFKKVGSDIVDVAKDVVSFINLIGGWKVAIIGIGALMMAGPVASVLSLGTSLGLTGLKLGTFALQSIPIAVKAIGILDVAAVIGQGSIVGLTASIGALLGKLALLGVAWEAGHLFGEYVVNPLINKVSQLSTGDENATLGGKIYDWTHSGQAATTSDSTISRPVVTVPTVISPMVAKAVNGNKKAPLGIRSNNPTNMNPGGIESVFATPEDGISAAVANLQKNYQGLSLAALADKWTGAARAGNTPKQTANYVSGLSAGTGLAPNQVPDLTNPFMVSNLVKAITFHENSQQPYSDDTINKGIARGMSSGGAQNINLHVKFANAPAGITAQAESKDSAGDMHVQTRISYSMGVI